MKATLLEQLHRDREAQTAVALVTRLADGAQRLVYADGEGPGELTLTAEQLSDARSLLNTDKSAMLGEGGDVLFVRSYVPQYRLFIVGAVHIAQVLAPMAAMAGYEVTIIDPRKAFASAERFPGVTLCPDWPDDVLQAQGINHQSAVVALSHDPKIDDPALTVALRSDAFYIGALGSKKTHAKRVERLTEAGLGEQLARICAPIGIKLGGRKAPEIAVSILAQIIEKRYGG